MTASTRSALSMNSRMRPSAPWRNSAPCGSTTATRPVRVGGRDHVLHPGPVGSALGRHAAEPVAAPLVRGPHLVTPVLQGERRVGDHAVEPRQARAGEERWLAEGVTADDLEVLDPVQQQVHPGDAGRGEDLLLAVELAPERLRAAAGALHVLDDLDQHAAGAARGVVDGLALLRVEDVDQQADDRARGVVLAGLLVRLVGEPLDQVLVRVAEDVRRDRRVGQRPSGEVLDQVLEPGSRAACPCCVQPALPKIP